MKAPACDPGDFCIAQRAKSTLFMPEIAKSACTPKRFQHVSLFPFFEVGFIGWIVRVSFAFDLDVPLDGSARGWKRGDSVAAEPEIRPKGIVEWVSSTLRLGANRRGESIQGANL